MRACLSPGDGAYAGHAVPVRIGRLRLPPRQRLVPWVLLLILPVVYIFVAIVFIVAIASIEIKQNM